MMMTMKKNVLKPLLLATTAVALCFSITGAAYAFNDVKNDPEQTAIEQLQQRGVINGVGQDQFAPKGTLTVGNAVALIVSGMKLNIDNIQFIKEPKASDYFTNVKDDFWYAQAFIIASHNGLDIPKDINPNAAVTREQYAHWLYNALETKGDYAWIEMYVMLHDEDQVDDAYMTSIQHLLIAKIAKLDDNSDFRPKKPITRSEAAGMLYRTIEYVDNVKPIEIPHSVLTDVKISSEKVSDDVAKITVSAQAPHPGYGFEVSSIQFIGSQAIVNYRVILPDPDKMYPQVVTEVKAETYVDAKYEAVLGTEEIQDSPGSTDPALPIQSDGSTGSGVIGSPEGTSSSSAQ